MIDATDVYHLPSETSVESPLTNRRSQGPKRQMTDTPIAFIPFASPIIATQAVVFARLSQFTLPCLVLIVRWLAKKKKKDLTNLALLPQQLEA